MSKIETTSKVSMKLTSSMNLELLFIITFIQYMKQVKNYKSHKNGLFKPEKKNNKQTDETR